MKAALARDSGMAESSWPLRAWFYCLVDGVAILLGIIVVTVFKLHRPASPSLLAPSPAE